MEGTLFCFDVEGRLSGFMMRPALTSSPKRACVFVPGLTDGFFGLPYLSQLASMVTSAGWHFVQ
jgi:hypothetical protein